MDTLTDKELEYLGEQRLGRLATVDGKGDPHVVPVVSTNHSPSPCEDSCLWH